jgi:hypothetical protein
LSTPLEFTGTRKDILSTDKKGFTQIIEKEEILGSLIPVSSFLICGLNSCSVQGCFESRSVS